MGLIPSCYIFPVTVHFRVVFQHVEIRHGYRRYYPICGVVVGAVRSSCAHRAVRGPSAASDSGGSAPECWSVDERRVFSTLYSVTALSEQC